MNHCITKPLILLALTVVLVSATLTARSSAAARASMRFVPEPRIAVVRLDAVIDGLNERGVRQVQFDTKRDELRVRIEGLISELADMEDKHELLPEDQKHESAKQMRRLRHQIEWERDFSSAVLEELQAEFLLGMFKKVDQAIDEIASQNSYTLVISDDSSVAIPMGSTADVTRAISLRRLLYVAPEHDVTDDVITYMNNQFAAVQ